MVYGTEVLPITGQRSCKPKVRAILQQTLRLADPSPGRNTHCRFVPMRRILTFVLFAASIVAGTPKNTPAPPFHVAIVSGDGALNSLPSRAAHEPIIRVADSSGKPIAGVRVDFDAPKAGPGAKFTGGSTHFSTTTNAEGVAKAAGLRNNGVPGGFAVIVHVSYQGQTLADMTVHQTNVANRVARVSSSTPSQQEPYPDASMSTAVVGIAMGDQFMVNGAPTPTNANLAPGSHVQTQNTPVTIFIHDHCEFLIGPHSSVVIEPHLVSVTSGAVRAKHFGDCKFGYGGLWVTSPSPSGDAVVALSSEHMEVGSVSGPVEISNALKVVGTVQAGSVSAFNFSSAASASGASITGAPSTKVAFMLGAGTAASLLGLGLAIDAISQPSSTASTSP